ncbi:MAG: SDR family oxidoreductase [Bacteroidales bacterium]|jgi:short-subunit dehydrogenase|nr:SDR family oxidoreductase [Bacteroidales bacterium]
MKNHTYTLITGASNGIGYELTKLFAAGKHNLILVARSENKLLTIKEELELQHGISIAVIAKDLSRENAAQELFEATQASGLAVDILVNNAGFGDFGDFLDADLAKLKNMLNLNVNTLIQMTYLYAGEMRKNGFGKVLNLASLAGLTAMPYFTMYAATKAFVLSFSQALDEELRRTGVCVTALCPGPVVTGFENAANMHYSPLMMIGAYSAKQIAKAGYKATMKGKSVQYGGWVVGLVNIVSRLLPRKLMRKIIKKALLS